MLHRLLILVYALLATIVLGVGAVNADVFPQVTLSYDAQTFTYTYHVSVAADNTHPFGQLLIFAHSINWDWDTEQEIWTMGGPIVGGVDQEWSATYSIENEFGGDTAEWNNTTGQSVISSWEGDFILVAPDTAPVAGLGMTKNGVAESVNYFEIDVPGDLVVPEPSSMIALASFAGLALSIRRRFSNR